MAADTYDSILGLILQGTGNNNNWGAVANNSMISPAARGSLMWLTEPWDGVW